MALLFFLFILFFFFIHSGWTVAMVGCGCFITWTTLGSQLSQCSRLYHWLCSFLSKFEPQQALGNWKLSKICFFWLENPTCRHLMSVIQCQAKQSTKRLSSWLVYVAVPTWHVFRMCQFVQHPLCRKLSDNMKSPWGSYLNYGQFLPGVQAVKIFHI